jgi:hypothetical protein
MRKIKDLTYVIILLFFCGVINSCSDDDFSEWEICTIKYMAHIDSCNDYMIVIEKEEQVNDIYYKPDKLPDDFKVDNLPVKVKYTITEEKHNCGFGGYVPIIHIVKIEKAKNLKK